MGWRGVFYSLFFLLTLVESSSRSGKMWSLKVGAGSTFVYSWSICSASIFVLVALVLSMYLIFEHLAAYNQPEELFLIGLILMVPVYALESLCDDVGSNLLHGIALNEGNARVSVLSLERDECAGKRLPIPNTGAKTLEEALGGYVAWPRHLIIMRSEIEMFASNKSYGSAQLDEVRLFEWNCWSIYEIIREGYCLQRQKV